MRPELYVSPRPSLQVVLTLAFSSNRSQMDNAKYRCKWGVTFFELVHFRPHPEVVKNAFDRIAVV